MEWKEEGFLDHFGQIKDYRVSKNQLYTVAEILFVTFCAVICGADGWQDVEAYGRSRIYHLREYLDYNNGTPSDDTVRRFFRYIDLKNFEQLFRDWVKSIAKKANVKVIAIDGKASRHSFDGDGAMLHTVSAFSTESRIVLGQERVDDKSNEITAIPKMLEWLDVKDHIITIDAMGCQYNIAANIIKKEGHYIFSLKGNQSSLFDDVKLYFQDQEYQAECAKHTDYDKGHGRIETRECLVTNNTHWLRERHPHWSSIKSIIRINSTRELKSSITTESRYYISSLEYPQDKAGAEKMLVNIRSHWAIENSLHWVLDMSFNDDQSRIRKGNAPYAMAIIRHIATNTLQLTKDQLDKPNSHTIKRLRKLCGWDTKMLDKALEKKSA